MKRAVAIACHSTAGCDRFNPASSVGVGNGKVRRVRSNGRGFQGAVMQSMFLSHADSPRDACDSVGIPVGTHGNGYICEKIEARRTMTADEYEVTATFSPSFRLRCWYAGRPIVVPSE